MFLSVTPIGSSATDVAGAAAAYVDYLCPSGPTAAAPVEQGAAVGYYAGAGAAAVLDGAGWWSGGGAGRYGLDGRVDRKDFEAMLHGRHHLTAERLVTARGSSGRTHLKAGNPTRLVDGQPVWSMNDATACLAMSISFDTLNDRQRVAVDGTDYVTLAGMRALLSTSDRRRPAITIEEIANGDGPVSLGDLAAAAGVSDRYLRKVCTSITAGDVGDESGLAPVKRGRAWMVDRAGALRWVRDRKPPAVRVGYDLTLTTEKSLSVFGLVNPEVREACVEILQDANAEALRWLDRNASSGRTRGAADLNRPLSSDSGSRARQRLCELLDAYLEETSASRCEGDEGPRVYLLPLGSSTNATLSDERIGLCLYRVHSIVA